MLNRITVRFDLTSPDGESFTVSGSSHEFKTMYQLCRGAQESFSSVFKILMERVPALAKIRKK